MHFVLRWREKLPTSASDLEQESVRSRTIGVWWDYAVVQRVATQLSIASASARSGPTTNDAMGRPSKISLKA